MTTSSDELTRSFVTKQSLPIRCAKAIRASQPFNYVATTALKVALQMLGRQSETAIKHLHRVGRVRSQLPNGRTLHLWTRADDFIANQVFWRGWQGYEPETTPVFWHLASSSRTTLDIGAHIGMMTLLASHANRSGMVYAFEPFRPVYNRLMVNVDINHVRNVECHNSAVGDVDTILDFYYIEFNNRSLPSSTSLSREFMERGLASYGLPASRLRCSPVPVMTIDQFVKSNQIRDIDLVKVDTESTELAVLRGMIGTITRDRPTLIVEILPGTQSMAELHSMLTPLGYRYCRLLPTSSRAQRIHKALACTTGRFDGYDNYLFSMEDPEQVVERALRAIPIC